MTNKKLSSKSMFPSSGNWSSEQLKLAFSFYCQTSFGKLHSRNPEIIKLANLIGRTPSALAMKLANFASLDPTITSTGRRGLVGASTLDKEIWKEFHSNWEGLAIECEQLRQRLLIEHGLENEDACEVDNESMIVNYFGETRQVIVQQRIKQGFFRRAVLAGYRESCCISGVGDPRFLVASHIVPWREDKANRLNPSNGICLSTIHDKAFDIYLFSLTDDYRVILSKQLELTKDKFLQGIFWSVQGRKINLPDRFVPEPSFLKRHRDKMLGINT